MRHTGNRRAPSAPHTARSPRRAGRRRPRRRLLLGVAALAALALVTLAAVRLFAAPSADGAGRKPGTRAITLAPSPGQPEPTRRGSGDRPAPSSSGTSAGKAAPPSASVPKSGTGLFSTAAADGGPAGRGTIRRYSVQVEGGAGISSAAAAKEIAGILADPRGWTADGHDGFQLVSSGPVDFEVKIATPDTVDRICGAAGLHTHGEVNCDVGDQVVVNLKRWLTGSPEFSGPLHEYRALIINHEVGHRIGHGHETCPGPGRPAPVMMQQIDGLRGCRANAWPYDAKGVYIKGPDVP